MDVVAGGGHDEELGAGDLGDPGLRSLVREQRAPFAANDEGWARDAVERRKRSRRDAEPARIELEAVAAVGVATDRALGDRAARRLGGVRRLRKEAEARNGLLPAPVAAPDPERAPRRLAEARRRPASDVEHHEAPDASSSGGVVERDPTAQGVSDQKRGLAAEILDEGGQILGEGTDEELVRMVGIAMATEIERHDVEAVREADREVVPPMDVSPAAVEEDERRIPGFSSMERVERDSSERGPRELPVARLHGRESRRPAHDRGVKPEGRTTLRQGPTEHRAKTPEIGPPGSETERFRFAAAQGTRIMRRRGSRAK